MDTDKKEIYMIITKEMGKLLAIARKQTLLTQKEVGERLGFSAKSGRMYISRLERGEIANPSLWIVLKYLTICEKSWPAFFEKLAGVYFTKRHDAVMSQVPDVKLDRKIDRDVAKYTHSINTKFAYKQKIKPLTQYQKQQMAVGFAKHRAVMEQIEREITNYLGNSGELPIYNQYYKAFARECYSTIRKTKPLKSQKIDLESLVNQKLNKIIEKWVKKGLKRKILEQVKEIPVKHFKPPMNTDKH